MSSRNNTIYILFSFIWGLSAVKACSTTDGSNCSFPFVYNGETYNECTNADSGSQFWCAAEVNADRSVKTKGTCALNCPRTTTPSPTECQATTGKKCVFPFKYKGQEYTGCTNAAREEMGITTWCATSVDANREVQGFGNCYTCTCAKDCTTTTGDTCRFPFFYRGEEYTKCTDSDSTEGYWCATSLMETGDASCYGICSQSCEKTEKLPSNVCQTTSGQKCIFPFNYKGSVYSSCTTVDYGNVRWCPTGVSKTNTAQEYGTCVDTCP